MINWLKTILILIAILLSTLWTDGQIKLLRNEINTIKAFLILKKIMPNELAKKENQ